MTRIILFVLLLMTVPRLINAQSYLRKENNIWINSEFGIDFNNGTPQPAVPYAFQYIRGGSASVCNSDGAILFYTNGNIVWDRNNQIMPHGWDINNDGTQNLSYIFTFGSGFQQPSDNMDGVCIVPMPGHSGKYYIFSVVNRWFWNADFTFAWTQWEGKLRYSVIDMTLNNGNGDVDTNHRGLVLADSCASGIQAVTGADCNYWLLSYDVSANHYRVFNIASAGIDMNPVISGANALPVTKSFEMNSSPNGNKLAQSFQTYVSVYDFNKTTGILSNQVNIPTALESWYMAFSPDESKLYLGTLNFNTSQSLQQFDISSAPPWNATALNLNYYNEYCGPFRLGPDGKIYLSVYEGDPSLGTGGTWTGRGARINNPNLAGTACQLTVIGNSLPMLAQNTSPVQPYYYQFPNEVPVIRYDTVSKTINAPLCFREPDVILNAYQTGATDFRWQADTVNGSGLRDVARGDSVLVARSPGIYIATYFTAQPCLFHQDTFRVEEVSFSLALGADKTSCDGKAIELTAQVANGAFLWSDGTTARTFKANSSGLYWVQVTKDGCTISDTIGIKIENLLQDLGVDTSLCIEKSVVLKLEANVTANASVKWSTGSTNTAIMVSESGTYWVSVSDSFCSGSDTIQVDKYYCQCAVFVPTSFTPNNDGQNDVFKPLIPQCNISKYNLFIYNRWGQLIWDSYRLDEGWDGTHNGRSAEVGSYMYYLRLRGGTNNEEMIRKGDVTLLR